MPPDYLHFLHHYAEFRNPGNTAWFLMLEDYAGTASSAFAWDEFQQQSLDAALDDQDKKTIHDFWGNHLPILISVKDGYSFLAISTRKDAGYPIVFGCEPEYEQVETFCPSFTCLTSALIQHINGTQPHPLLARML